MTFLSHSALYIYLAVIEVVKLNNQKFMEIAALLSQCALYLVHIKASLPEGVLEVARSTLRP